MKTIFIFIITMAMTVSLNVTRAQGPAEKAADGRFEIGVGGGEPVDDCLYFGDGLRFSLAGNRAALDL